MEFKTARISPATVAASTDMRSPPFTNQPSKGRENDPWVALTPACKAERSSINTNVSVSVDWSKELPLVKPSVVPRTNQSGPTETLAPVSYTHLTLPTKRIV